MKAELGKESDAIDEELERAFYRRNDRPEERRVASENRVHHNLDRRRPKRRARAAISSKLRSGARKVREGQPCSSSLQLPSASRTVRWSPMVIVVPGA